MTDRFDICLPIILDVEKGYSNDPNDPGGPTNLGITQAALSGYLGRSATIADVKALTPATVAPIYQIHYWDAASCGHLPAGVDLMVFDCAVNMGVGTSIRFLQEAASVAVDGVIGPHTIAAIGAENPASLIIQLASLRRAKYQGLPTFWKFGDGWLSRVAHIEQLATGMIA